MPYKEDPNAVELVIPKANNQMFYKDVMMTSGKWG